MYGISEHTDSLDTFRTVVHKQLAAGFRSLLLFSSFCAPDGWVLFVLGVFKVLFRFGPSLLTGWCEAGSSPASTARWDPDDIQER